MVPDSSARRPAPVLAQHAEKQRAAPAYIQKIKEKEKRHYGCTDAYGIRY